MASNEEIMEYAKYYLGNEEVSMKQSAEHFGISKKTFQVNMKKLESISPTTFKLVQEKKERNLKNGAVKGGQNGKPTYVEGVVRKTKYISDGDIVYIAMEIVKNKYTIREAEKIFKINRSTLHDNLTEERLGKELYSLIVETAQYNKANTNKDLKSRK